MRVRTLLAFLASLTASIAGAQETKVRVAYVPVVGAAPVFIAAGAGWAKEAGLDIALVRFDSGPPAISAVASGTIDALAIGVAPVAVARARGLDVRIIASASTGGSGFLARGALASAFDATSDPARALAEFRRLNGRAAKLATLPPGAVPNVLLRHWLFKLHKTDPADAQVSALGIDAVQQALLTGAVDGGTVLEPSLTIVRQRNPALKLVAGANDMFEGIPGVVLAVTGAFANANPGAPEKLVRLLIRANALIASDPAAAARHSSGPLGGGGLIDTDTLARAFQSKTIGFATDPAVIEEPTRRMLAYQAEIGDFAEPPPMGGLFDKAPFAAASRR